MAAVMDTVHIHRLQSLTVLEIQLQERLWVTSTMHNALGNGGQSMVACT
jgi:hypothetical protein